MCGICGIINYNQKFVHKEQIKAMMKSLKHRVPDDEWFREPFFKELIFEILNINNRKLLPYINLKEAKKLYEAHLNKKINISRDTGYLTDIS